MATIDLTKGPGQHAPADQLEAFADGSAARVVGDRKEPPRNLSPENVTWWLKGYEAVK